MHAVFLCFPSFFFSFVCFRCLLSLKCTVDVLISASQEETKGLKTVPVPLDPEETQDRDHDHCLSARQFHNLFYDGFYAPYMSNPEYLLLVDTREETAFLERHILSATWHGKLDSSHEREQELSRYILIILYDQDGTGIHQQDSIINQLRRKWKTAHLDPVCIYGRQTSICPLLITLAIYL